MDGIQEMFAQRIGGREFGRSADIFKFEKIKRAKRQAVKEHPEMKLIDLGVGESDSCADLGIIEELNYQARQWENRGYADNGIDEFKQAAAGYLEQVYGVNGINAETEILHCIGTKSALAMLPQAFIDPNDVTLLTVPGYPIIGTKTKWLGGESYPLPLCKENGYFPDFEEIPGEILERAKLLYINYPNNPTGTIAKKEFFEKVICFAKEHQILVVQDAAYAGLTFDGANPLSFLSIPGAKEVGIEVHSLSKAYNMTGWRIGFVAGNSQIIKALAAVKDNNDAGQFRAIQKAGVYALHHPELTELNCKKYERRHRKLAGIFREAGFEVSNPKATFYEYIPIPRGTRSGIRFETAEKFSDFLIREALISTVPWDDAGHYIRISVTFVAKDEEEEDSVMAQIRERLRNCELIF